MINHTIKSWMTLILCMALMGCDSLSTVSTGGTDSTAEKAASATSALGGPTLTMVNGKPISQGLFDAYLQQRTARQPLSGSQEELDAIMKELIDMELVLQDAERNKVDQQPAIAGQLELQRRGLLVRADLQQYVSNHPVTEEEQREFYTQQIAQMNKEYKARHILATTEEEARAMIAELDGGKDFAQLAKDHSTGPTANQGGDLGWFPVNRMVAPFGNAVAAMQKGTYSKEPVQTQFGWHVILLEDVRDATPPSFEESKDRILGVMRNQRVENYLKDLRNSAQIEVKAQPQVAPPPVPEAQPEAQPEAAPDAESQPKT